MKNDFIQNHNHNQNHNQNQLQKMQAQKADRNLSRVMQFEQAMFNSRSRHLVLVLTLSYKPEWQDAITLDSSL